MTTSIAPERLSTLLATLDVVDLGHTYAVGMPQSPNHPPYRMLLERRHGDMVREDGGSAANDLIVLGGHVGTHIDALAHVSQDGRLFGGVDASSVQSHQGLAVHDISTFAPTACRGVLLDVAATHGVDVLPAGYGITADDLEAARVRAGVELRPGDAVLVGTGWGTHWSDRERFQGQSDGVPGPDTSGGEWLAAHRPSVVGGETIAFEQIPPGRGHATLPVHRIMLVDHGINIIETMRLDDLRARGATEFVLILSPLKIKGGTGAPVRPIALVDRTEGVA